MSDAPERISLELRQGMADDFWSECRDPRYAKSAPVAYVRADRIEAQEALLKEAETALGVNIAMLMMAIEVTDIDPDETLVSERLLSGGKDFGDRPLSDVIAAARATLAKLREHLGETK